MMRSLVARRADGVPSAQYLVLSTRYPMLRWIVRSAAFLSFLFAGVLFSADDKPQAAKADAQPAGAIQDLVYFAQTRPILIRLHIEVDGRAFDDAWDDYIAALFKFLDRDGDGVLNLAEAARAPTAQ